MVHPRGARGAPGRGAGGLRKPVVASAWYPYSAFVALVHAVERRHGRGEGFALSRELGRQGAARDLGGTFRIITAMASVAFLLKRAQIFWSQYCDRGRIVMEMPSPNAFVARMEGFPEVDPAHCRLIEGWLQGMGDALGAIDMSCRHTRCVRRGHAACAYAGAWTGTRGLLS